MFDSKPIESSIQEDIPYIVVSGGVVDLATGELFSLGRVRELRKLIDWQKSLKHLTERIGQEKALSVVLDAFWLAWPEYPGFVPGFWLDNLFEAEAPGREEDAADNRGLSNSNKVRTVILKNRFTGKTLELDRVKIRLAKMRRRVFAWADAVSPYLDRPGFRKVMITLTYANIEDWQANQIRDYNKRLKEKLGQKLLAMAWVAELQERGAVHYHVILIVKKGTRIPMPDKSGMWVHGSSRVETARTIYYLCSYLKKKYQKEGEYPKGLRMYAVFVNKGIVTALEFWKMRLSTLPVWFADRVKGLSEFEGEKWSRMPGGGWLFGGSFFRSPFSLVGFA